jgi:pilus assembly protein CpaB
MTRHTSETVLNSRRIIALNPASGTAALEVSPEESAQLEVARSMGRISLALRGADDGGDNRSASAADTDVSAAFGRKIASGNKKAVARVLVAAEELQAGVLLRDIQLEWRSVATLPAGDRYFLEGRDERERLHGALLKQSLAAGQPIPSDSITMPGDPGFMAAVLNPGFRAASIGIDPVSGISGFVSPGDYVDVVLTQELDQAGKNITGTALKKRLFSETILQNLRILAIKQTVDTSSGQPVAARTATLEVNPEKAQILAVAAKMGKLSLSLRGNGSEAETNIPYSTDVGVSGQLAEWVGGAPKRSPAPAPVVVQAAPAESKAVVKVYKGAQVSEQAF